ncbi:acyl-CoA thioesterase [Clostridium folliculivorans]|uniref:Thioesterase n=1 Tax=Clostridium folliculivorans TaxID=2886038 RepID=A0A9W6DCM7_9CLOT|nr:thioesterase family protein [Clostridium folliculivorans]GKU27660.1 thioesterase [Clostridium folliculivorans]GKU32423.1 thioesterase [Clostridium folliculivorans]
MNISETKIKVRYVETDQMGIVHHSNYYAWFEVGRTEFIKESGISYSDMENNGIMMPLVESSCRYMVGAKYEDEVTIKTWVEELNGAKVVFSYEVIRDDDNITLARGKTIHAFVNKDFKIINLKKNNLDIWDRIHGLL